MSHRPAFTLIELIVALVLSTFVLVAIVGVTSQMLRYGFESGRKSESTNWSLMSLNSMKKELLRGSILISPPPPNGTTSMVLSGCSNWTTNTGFATVMGAPPCVMAGANKGCPLDGNAGNVRSFYYCVWSGHADGVPRLLHYAGTGTCPISPMPTCGVTGGFDVVAHRIYPDAGAAYIFKRDDTKSGVEMQFMVGYGTASVTGTPSSAVPTAQHIRTTLSMNKSYGNSLD
jgi:Tfp pilus assembly protein PilV